MADWTWFDPAAGVALLQPHLVQCGMRLAKETRQPDGSRVTRLTPVWDISLGGTYEIYGGTGYSFRTSDGVLHPVASSARVWVHPEIRPEDLPPPHHGDWITHQRFGQHDHRPGVLGDRYFYQRTRAVDRFTAADGRVYRLLRGASTRADDRRNPDGRWECYWVYRWDQGVKWIGPSRETSDLAYMQFDLICNGEAW
ncbi:hypothetical protein [Streptomyces sp. NPDC059003]|uniref:hypothetical protein n=1 Tax=Streptomyces sp. NPDC059003 TaxID=3346691 RepID=UPI0036D06F72